ncbi:MULTISPECIES: PIG-L deacetylase family protein [Protofrankia]|uniref:PIG-L deacetylase family protein n=1 Tax=Protofrankia TaxID=2994361 RepID=UPI00064043F4|nr:MULTISPECIES: PIG-L family deacetylase [Protofrankia]ONH34312.1 GlcNAc-PI de-N-acetylase [Protofrankia sp. BMG5.30]
MNDHGPAAGTPTPAGTARPGSVLAVMAHPDDAELWAGGTLALHARAAGVTIAVPRNTADRMAEAAAGARVLGARLHVLDPERLAVEIQELLVDLCPEIVVTHPPADVHPRHRRVAAAVLEALPRAVLATGRPRRLYTCDSYNSLTMDGPVRATAIVDVTATFDVKLQALRAHGGTQPIGEEFAPMAENLGRLWGARIGVAYAEGFVALPVLGRLPGATCL